MIKKYIWALRMTREAFRGKEVGLVFWIIVRGLSLACSPIVFPLTIKILFDTLQIGDNIRTLNTCLIIILYILPVYLLNYYISYFSDAWVIKNVYEWMKNNLHNVTTLSYDKVNKSYDTGNLQNCVISGSWAGIQAWVHLFRLISPIVTVIVLISFVVSYSPYFLIFVGVITFLDVAINEFEAKKRHEIYKEINKNSIIREEKIGEIVNKIEYICMNNMYKVVVDEYRLVQKEIWAKEQDNIICTILFESINEVLERTVTCFLVHILFDLKPILQMTAGAIGSINTIFDNLRERVKYVKSQTEATVSKVRPIERLNTLMNMNCTDMVAKRKVVHTDDKFLIKGDGVAYVVGGLKILDNINIVIERGEKIAIIGKNGSGKSTFIRLLAGLYTPTMGQIIFISNEQRDVIVSYAPSSSLLFREVSVFDNIGMGRNAETDLDEMTLINNFGLSDIKTNYANQISGGQAQRTNIARSMFKQADLYLLDEPTASLDKEWTLFVAETLQQYINKTIVFITHKPILLDYVNRVIILDKGMIVYDGGVSECKNCVQYNQWITENQS